MTSRHMEHVINPVDLLGMAVRDAAEALRALLRAKRVALRPVLGDDIGAGDARLMALLPVLQSIGLPVGPAVSGEALAGDALVLRTAAPEGAPTDAVTLSVPLAAHGAPFIAVLEVQNVMLGWDSRENMRGIAALKALIERNLEGLMMGPALVAEPFLRLVTYLQDLDDGAVSHALGGLLRILSGQSPSRVEAIAMQISGLAQSRAPAVETVDICLTDAAQDILDKVGIGRTASAVAMVRAAPPAVLPVITAPEILAPFARLHLADETFEVAEAEATGHYWFRRANAAEGIWAPLANRGSDGWTAVSAEILTETRDIAQEFARMHVIRRRDIQTDEIAESYELPGIAWSLRPGDPTPEARLAGMGWQPVTLPADLGQNARAVAALFQIVPGLSERLADDARDWVNRMARAVQVMPCLPGIAA